MNFLRKVFGSGRKEFGVEVIIPTEHQFTDEQISGVLDTGGVINPENSIIADGSKAVPTEFNMEDLDLTSILSETPIIVPLPPKKID